MLTLSSGYQPEWLVTTMAGTHFSDNQHWTQGLVSLMLSVQVKTSFKKMLILTLSSGYQPAVGTNHGWCSTQLAQTVECKYCQSDSVCSSDNKYISTPCMFKRS